MSEGVVAVPAQVRHKLHDPNVMIEEYFYYARIQREQEKQGLGPVERQALFEGRDLGEPGTPSNSSGTAVDEKIGEIDATPVAPIDPQTIVTGSEWETASRAVRNASWGSMFVSPHEFL